MIRVGVANTFRRYSSLDRFDPCNRRLEYKRQTSTNARALFPDTDPWTANARWKITPMHVITLDPEVTTWPGMLHNLGGLVDDLAYLLIPFHTSLLGPSDAGWLTVFHRHGGANIQQGVARRQYHAT